MRALFGCLLVSCAMTVSAFEKVALVDIHDFWWQYDIETVEGLRQTMEHVAKTGADSALVRVQLGASVRFPSHEEFDGQPSFDPPIDKRRIPSNTAGGWLRLNRKDPDHLAATAKLCAQLGMRFGYHWSMEENHLSSWSLGGWNLAHPRYWCRRFDGPLWPGRASVAWPEVIDHKIKVFDEALTYGPDTVLVDFYRCHAGEPEWDYVKPAIEDWKRLHPGEPVPADWHDERWIRHIKRYHNEFLRQMKAHAGNRRMWLGVDYLDEKGTDYLLNRRGVDWRELVRGGLVDGIVVMSVVPNWSDPWRSTKRIYEGVMHDVAGRCPVYFPVKAYTATIRPGIGEYVKRTGLGEVEVVRRFLEMAAEVGGAGIVMECVDYKVYSDRVCETIKTFAPK